jgi:tetratricopeptide (TPR) repeat protein
MALLQLPPPRSTVAWRFATLALAVATLTGCGAPQGQVVTLDPIEFKVDRTGGEPRVYVRDEAALTQEAMAKYEAAEWAEAVRLFDVILREFPQTTNRFALLYNAGLALLHLRKPAQAAERFSQAMQAGEGTRQARDALFLLAEAQEQAGQFAASAATLKSALEDAAVQQRIGGPLGLLDQLEATARVGLVLRKAGDPTGADLQFRRIERLYNDHRDVALVGESEWVARALYERGEIYRELFTSIRFKLPVDRMKRDLEDKANLFLKAETVYFKCVRLQHRKWALAAGFEIGHLYSRLIDDIENAEAPDGLDEFTLDVYRDELWNHTERLAKRSIVIYRNNIQLAERLGEAGSDWVAKSEEQIARMEAMIEANNQRRARLMQAGMPAPTAPPPSSEPVTDEPPTKEEPKPSKPQPTGQPVV